MMGVMIALLVLGLAMKNNINNSLSEMLREQVSDKAISLSKTQIDSLYNYEKNNSAYEITFLEFGAKGCSACKRMEGVMDIIRQKYGNTVNVVFINVVMPENRNLMNYYGIAAIPTQVLLDKKGSEYFRHTGYIPADKLDKKFQW